MEIIEHAINAHCEGVVVEPVGGSAVGVLVLAGSSGRIETDRCRLLARTGMTALSIRWFGGEGQPAGICEIPLETFSTAIDLLRAKGAERIGVLGVSKGAEAALLLAVHDPRVDAVVALSPTSVVWANVGPGSDGEIYPYRSSWTWRGSLSRSFPTTTVGLPRKRKGSPLPTERTTSGVCRPLTRRRGRP
ncbi:acyl-CoA thioester hydrolase/BAAT C-terminal domain-containing protein [Kitasatospora acidiphila]|uniref:acyl-CoA thioester hydrolase/BAAT C-terminal domain-containing protein n=1 Tax=Kitasatospora acidiphila TaxID=2567942 RepID=UPI002265D03F|nr:acyl-CoA thioester hydrolase/BAAT C-terminal domain-containing protein [Kitasatospora acidiphila]